MIYFPSFSSKPIHICSSCHNRLSRLQTNSLKHSIATFKKEFMAWKRCRSTTRPSKHPTSTSSTKSKKAHTSPMTVMTSEAERTPCKLPRIAHLDPRQSGNFDFGVQHQQKFLFQFNHELQCQLNSQAPSTILPSGK